MKALELKALISHETTGNLLSLTRQLEAAMVNRQDYMRANRREDLNLNRLYQEEKHAAELHRLLANGGKRRPRGRDLLLHRRL